MLYKFLKLGGNPPLEYMLELVRARHWKIREATAARVAYSCKMGGTTYRLVDFHRLNCRVEEGAFVKGHWCWVLASDRGMSGLVMLRYIRKLQNQLGIPMLPRNEA